MHKVSLICDDKSVRGDHLERQIRAGLAAFLRNPQPALQHLHSSLGAGAEGSGQIRKQIVRLEGLLARRATECSRLIGTDLNAKLEQIGKEEAALEAQLADLRSRIAGADSVGVNITSAKALLEKLWSRPDEQASWLFLAP